jgi:hypothetical protein
MKQITFTSIDAAIDLVDHVDDNGLEDLCEKHATAQPELIDYILSAAVEYENPDLEGLLIYYFCLLMESYSHAECSLKKIEVQDIEDCNENEDVTKDNLIEKFFLSAPSFMFNVNDFLAKNTVFDSVTINFSNPFQTIDSPPPKV